MNEYVIAFKDCVHAAGRKTFLCLRRSKCVVSSPAAVIVDKADSLVVCLNVYTVHIYCLCVYMSRPEAGT